MIKRSMFFLFVFSLILKNLAGCCNIKRTYSPIKSNNLVDIVRKRNGKAGSLKAVVKADQFTKKGRVKLKVYILTKKGGKLRFEATVMDNTVAVLATDGEKFRSIDFKKHIVYEGPSSPCNIARIFNIPLTGEQVAVVLMGGVPILRHQKSEVEWDKCKGREILILKNKPQGLSQKIYLKRKKGSWQILGTIIKNRKGKTLLRVLAKDFRLRDGLWVGRWTHYLQPKKKADVMMRFISQKLNVEIPEEAFSIDPPRGLETHWLECPDIEGLPFEAIDPEKEEPTSKE